MENPPKRVTGALDEDLKLITSKSDASCINPFATVPSVFDIRAFGLEDRAEAIISCGQDNWTLANLLKWRTNALDKAYNDHKPHCHNTIAPKEYLRQRQRAYRHQLYSKKLLIKTHNNTL
ncbi:hypothetical protein CCR75_002249 [Bremia lactucae]|uniref:Uncharacterized protein n=1 Tax=Bremia lactucae TaxID=4779 RepID=A0A976FNV2_BRELC|nr:hypothetical protein CCR75_002249 [Bremia lactucae]